METNANEFLEVGADGAVNTDPLIAWNFRFDPKTSRWSRCSLRKVGLPRPVSRATVSQEVGVAEEAIKNWETAVKRQVLPRLDDAMELLTVEAVGPVDRDPLAKWHLRFYPESRRWRRTRSSREEVSRSSVAKKVGVPEEVLLKWEDSFLATAEGASRPKD